MSTTLEKEWAAIDGEEILMKEDTRERLNEALIESGRDPDSVEIVAIPKSHSSLFI